MEDQNIFGLPQAFKHSTGHGSTTRYDCFANKTSHEHIKGVVRIDQKEAPHWVVHGRPHLLAKFVYNHIHELLEGLVLTHDDGSRFMGGFRVALEDNLQRTEKNRQRWGRGTRERAQFIRLSLARAHRQRDRGQ